MITTLSMISVTLSESMIPVTIASSEIPVTIASSELPVTIEILVNIASSEILVIASSEGMTTDGLLLHHRLLPLLSTVTYSYPGNLTVAT